MSFREKRICQVHGLLLPLCAGVLAPSACSSDRSEEATPGESDGVPSNGEVKDGCTPEREVSMRWDVESDGFPQFLAADEQGVYSWTEGAVSVHDGLDGSIRWTMEGAQSGAVADGVAFLLYGDQGARIDAIDAMDGGEQWSTELQSNVDPGGCYGTVWSATSTEVVASFQCAGTDETVVVALQTSDGAELWRVSTPVTALAVAEDGTVFTAGDGIRALGAQTGAEIWNVTGVCQRLAVASSGRVFCASTSGGLLALEPLNGAKSWSREFDELTSGLWVSDDLVLTKLEHAGGQALVAFDQDGEERWRHPTTQYVPVSVGGGHVLFGDGGAIRALNPTTGEVLWDLVPGGFSANAHPGLIDVRQGPDGTAYVAFGGLNAGHTVVLALEVDENTPDHTCAPCALSCAGNASRTRCAADGSTMTDESVPCDSGQECILDACTEDFPGGPAAASADEFFCDCYCDCESCVAETHGVESVDSCDALCSSLCVEGGDELCGFYLGTYSGTCQPAG